MWTQDRRERKAVVRCNFFFVCFVDREIVAEEWSSASLGVFGHQANDVLGTDGGFAT